MTFAQIAPPLDVRIEQLGVAGFLVMAAYFMLKYFMSEIGKKDVQIQLLVTQQQAVAKENLTLILTELRENHAVKAQLVIALNDLTASVKGRKGDSPLLLKET